VAGNLKKLVPFGTETKSYIVINFPTNDGSPEITYRNACSISGEDRKIRIVPIVAQINALRLLLFIW
jgi:hypothetical protein